MSLKPFCNKCLKVQVKFLLVTSCRHVVCTECYTRSSQRCGVCNVPCKALPFAQLSEEMQVYFRPILPGLKKLLKITQFQLQQRSLWTTRRKHVIVRMQKRRESVRQKRKALQMSRDEYKEAVRLNAEMKMNLKKKRRAEPENPFEMNSNRNLGDDDELERIQSQSNVARSLDQTPGPFNASSRSSLSSRSNASTVVGYSPMLNATPRRMSSTANTSAFFNGSTISASSSLNTTASDSGSRTGQLRRLLQNSTIRSASPPSHPHPKQQQQHQAQHSGRLSSRNYRWRKGSPWPT